MNENTPLGSHGGPPLPTNRLPFRTIGDKCGPGLLREPRCEHGNGDPAGCSECIQKADNGVADLPAGETGEVVPRHIADDLSHSNCELVMENERLRAILDAVTDKVMSYRPVDKGLAAKKTKRKLARKAKRDD